MSATSIPRFLLPQRTTVWLGQQPRQTARGLLSFRATPSAVRYASTKSQSKSKSSNKAILLEQPTKFVPPSHPSRLRRTPKQYPGPKLSEEDEKAQQKRQYPNMMPPEGTFLHWFLNSTSIHVYITLSFLTCLAAFTFITNFKQTSDFGDMLPPTSHVLFHPLTFFRTWVEVYKLHSAKEAARIAENRKRMTDDVVKRDDYRQAHGLNTDGWGGWTAKRGDPRDPNILAPETPAAAEVAAPEEPAPQEEAADARSKRPVKRWLGIW